MKHRFRELQPSHWNRARLRTLLSKFAGLKILVVGDVGVDRYTIGTVERISPEAPVPIVLVQEEKLKLGLAANVAENIQALGGIACLIGVVGADRSADDFRKLLKNAKIKPAHLIADKSRRTVVKERVVSERQQLLRVDYESNHSIGKRVEAELILKIRGLVSKCDAIILEDYAKGMVSARLAKVVFELGLKNGKVVSVDPNAKTQLERYRGATFLTPNTREAEMLSGIAIKDALSLSEAGHRMLTVTEAKYVVITRGREGMAVFSADSDEVILIPTYAREVYDVSGAGDTVIALMSLALAAGASMEEAAVLGNLGAGVEVGKRGTATVVPEEIRVAMDFFGSVGV